MMAERSRWRLCGEATEPREIVATLARELRPAISEAVRVRPTADVT